MPDTPPARPRLVSVGDAASTPPSPPPEASEPEAHSVPRRVLWFVAALVLATAVGLFVQAQKVRNLERANAELTGELYTARSALEAYAERFAAVRESVAGLTAQLAELDALVGEDPATGEAPAAPRPADPEAAAR